MENVTFTSSFFPPRLQRTCDNIYIGFGHKFSSIKHCGPSVMPALAAEFPLAGYHEDDIAADDEDEVDGNQ